MLITDRILLILPGPLQYLIFTERVVKVALKKNEKANKVLQSQKKKDLRKWRPSKPFGLVRTARLDLLRLSRAYRQKIEGSSLYGRYRRAHNSISARWYAHLGQLSAVTLYMQLTQG